MSILAGFVKAQSDNFPKIDVLSMFSFLRNNPDFTEPNSVKSKLGDQDGEFVHPDFEERKLLSQKYDICMKNCKQECLKLQYKYTTHKGIKQKSGNMLSHIRVVMKNNEVTILRHCSRYSSGDIFSHVGGLLGCWLGISVFTFTDIVEKFFMKVVRWRRFRKEKEQMSPTTKINQN